LTPIPQWQDKKMPFAFILVGLALLTSGVRGTSQDLATLLKGDFTGPKNFIYWMLSILLIGSIGYIEKLRPLSRAFMVLVIVVLFLANDPSNGLGFFQKFQAAIDNTITPGSNTIELEQSISNQNEADTMQQLYSAIAK
jgi:uncharacterized membrane-anchored protein YitT (DUF2179 family)